MNHCCWRLSLRQNLLLLRSLLCLCAVAEGSRSTISRRAPHRQNLLDEPLKAQDIFLREALRCYSLRHSCIRRSEDPQF